MIEIPTVDVPADLDEVRRALQPDLAAAFDSKTAALRLAPQYLPELRRYERDFADALEDLIDAGRKKRLSPQLSERARDKAERMLTRGRGLARRGIEILVHEPVAIDGLPALVEEPIQAGFGVGGAIRTRRAAIRKITHRDLKAELTKMVSELTWYEQEAKAALKLRQTSAGDPPLDAA